RAHAFPQTIAPLEFFFVEEFLDRYASLRSTGCEVVTRPDLRWLRCDIKSTNLLPNVLAYQEALDAGGHEALLYRSDGTLTEGTHTSLFGVRNGAVVTAPATSAILPGITRRLIFRLAQGIGLPVRE